MMKEKVLLICSILVTLSLITTIKPVQAQRVETWMWVSPAYTGPDEFFDEDVVAYKTGTTALLTVSIRNTLDERMARTIVLVQMDWAATNASSGTTVDIPPNGMHLFQVSIPVPDTTIATNLALHSYIVFMDYNVGTVVHSDIIIDSTEPRYLPFAVYSADQLDYQNLSREYDTLWTAYTELPPQVILSQEISITSKAKDLFIKAAVEAALGDQSYRLGSFSDAKTHYDTALSYTRDAITSDIEKAGVFEDALIDLVDAGKSCLSMLGIAFTIFGVGFLLMGIGVLIYLIRRSKPPAA